MWHHPDHIPREHLRVREYLVNRLDRTARNACCSNLLQPEIHLLSLKDRLQMRNERLSVLHPRGICRKTVIPYKLWLVHKGTQLLPLPLIDHRKTEKAV